MFIGHFAIGLAAKSLKPRASLGTYFLAAQFVDLLWPTLLLLNLESVAIAPGITEMTPLDFTSYPYSHSLVMAFAWSAAAFVIFYFLRKDASLALLMGLCVASHWMLDFVTHRPDLPLMLNESVKVGLGLWNNKWATVAVEAFMYAAAILMYLKATTAKDKMGSIGFWSLIGFISLIHLGNIFGPPPPDVDAIAWAGHLQWLFVIWAYWVDAHRTSGKSPES
jgi:hypothetical protein